MTVKSRLISLFIVALVIIVTQTSVIAQDSDYKKILSRNSRKCLDINGASRDHLANLIQWNCHGGSNQKFKLRYVEKGKGAVAIIPSHSGKCLDVAYWRTNNGSNVIQANCHYGKNQLWEIEHIAKTPYAYIKSVHSGKCLDVSGVSQANGANVYIWDCGGGPNQQWYVE